MKFSDEIKRGPMDNKENWDIMQEKLNELKRLK